MVYLTRREHFNAAHKLYNADWSEAKNEEVFGKCSNANWHGHNFDLFITVKGDPDPDTGFIVNVKDLSRIINREIIDELDHKNLNLDVSWMTGIMPSIENLIIKIWGRLEPFMVTCELHCVKLVETENIYAEYFGK